MPIYGRYTERVQMAMRNAQKAAESLSSRSVGTEHMLLGLLMLGESIPEAVSACVTEEKVQAILVRIGPPTSIHAGLTPGMKKLMLDSIQTAVRYRQTYVRVEHVWLAMLDEQECQAWRVLNELKVNLETARTQLQDMLDGEEPELKRPEQPEPDPPPMDRPRREPEGDRLQDRRAGQRGSKFLQEFTRDLTQAAQNNELDPVVGRDEEIRRVIQILIRRTKNNPVLIGEAGVGKTAVVEGLAHRIVAGDVPEMLKGRRLLLLNVPDLVAGTRYRGDFEERMKRCLEEIRKDKSILLFIDEIHMIVGAGDREGSMDAANLLKPVLARGELQCIGATTLDEYRTIERDAALERRFQSVMVQEPGIPDTEQILIGLRDRFEAHHKVQIGDDAIRAAVLLSDRYIPDRRLPDKAIDLMDEAAASVRMEAMTTPLDLTQQEQELEAVLTEKREAISSQNFERAAAMRDTEQKLRRQITERRTAWETQRASARMVVTEQDVSRVVANWTGIPVAQMSASEADRIMHLEERLHERVVGQDEAVHAVAQAIRRSRAGLRSPRRPIGSFLMLGPTGVGKTELCRALSEVLFGDEDAVVRLDMSEFMERHTVSRLIGSTPGYVGYEEGGQLTEAVRRKPYCVVLLDEIEKAHPDVFNVLLQVLEDGRLTDGQGRVVSFKNTIVVMTSNAGAQNLEKARAMGFGVSNAPEDVRSYERMKETMLKEVKQDFRPEFINRIDEMIVFHALTKEDLRVIAGMMLTQLAKQLRENGGDLTWDGAVLDYLTENAYEPKFGARPLRRMIQRTVEDLLSEELITGRLTLGDTIHLTMEGDALRAGRADPPEKPAPSES